MDPLSLPSKSRNKQSTFFYYNTSGIRAGDDDNNNGDATCNSVQYTLSHCQHRISDGLDECIEATTKMSIQPYNNNTTASSSSSLATGAGPPQPYSRHQEAGYLNNKNNTAQSLPSIIMPLGQGARTVHWADNRGENKSSMSLAIKNDDNNTLNNSNGNDPALLPTNSAISKPTNKTSQNSIINEQQEATNQRMGHVLSNHMQIDNSCTNSFNSGDDETDNVSNINHEDDELVLHSENNKDDEQNNNNSSSHSSLLANSSTSTAVQYYTPQRDLTYEQPVTYVITAVDSPSTRDVNVISAVGADSTSNISPNSTTGSFFASEQSQSNDPFDRISGIDKHSAMDWSKELTEEQIAEYYDAFCFFDRDGSGAISTGEIAQVLISIGQATSEIEVREMLAMVDSNDSGSIDFPEFLKVMAQQRRKKEFLRDVRQAFKIFDKDGNGYITAVELRQVMTNMLGEKMTDDEVEALIFEADLDGDGQINFDEFVKYMFGYFEESKPNR